MGRVIRTIAVVYLLILVFFAWGYGTVRYQWFPYQQLEPWVSELDAFFRESHQERVADIVRFDHQERRNPFNVDGLRIADAQFHDDGYLLISRYSKQHGQTIVELLRIADDAVLHTWVPNLEAIFALTPNHQGGVNTRMAYRTQHPLLLDNGDLVTGSGEGPLVRIDACGAPRWAIDRHFHHSIEQDASGRLVVPIAVSEGPDEHGINVRDDGFAIVSLDGEVLAEYAMSDILLGNGYQALVFGIGPFEFDRYHLNDAQPLPGATAEEGILLSIRNLSTVALFVPATGKIEWLKTGPWLNQHDVNALDDGRYSVFGNNLVRGPELILGQHSNVYIYDATTDTVETPYTDILQRVDMRTPYEGRSRILANGDLFVEETNRDRLLRVSADTLRWEYVSAITDSTTGALHWSRYLEGNTVNTDWMETVSCE